MTKEGDPVELFEQIGEWLKRVNVKAHQIGSIVRLGSLTLETFGVAIEFVNHNVPKW